ncbi:hypothetical protein [Paraglaciecola arctica]|uniref:Uncharacterized protein n=1 Tax=Paraglaciecola arctica BSs20135 TaxID=493475 RepID=K6Z7F7_9ALTE|nr:hypothetical protein [Paraglaciecola arctica]GAC19370.1 hypothetical protein GARC_2404 [Paraglaciecola arctica BSs20135]
MKMKFAQAIFLVGILNVFTVSLAIADELISWNNTVASDFSAQQCVTIHGTPGTPKKCASSYTQKYHCPTIKHPDKHCHHTISGPCTPAVPGTPDVKQCANVSLGNFSIAVDGGVFTEYAGINDSEIAVQTTVNIAMFGKHASLPLTCKIDIGKKVSICMNLLTRTLSQTADSGYSCEIAGADVASISSPGVTANFCMDVTVEGVTGKPTGSVTARVDAGVEFGSANVAGHTLSMGSKDWNPALFSVKF